LYYFQILISAYEIRLYAIHSYGLVIHEFDPWFNFRATQYLADNGWTAFFHWFDHRSWYPLGRPVGTTIYPGMQITSVAIWKALEHVGRPMVRRCLEIKTRRHSRRCSLWRTPPARMQKIEPDSQQQPARSRTHSALPPSVCLWQSLNDVCCMVPAWFGALATFFLMLLTWECSGSANAGVAAGAIMAIIPAHIMRSVGGGYDNESVAMTAMLLTFYLWNRSLRAPAPKFFAFLAALAYVFMVAAWGGYIFVINLIGVHAALLVAMGYYTDDIYWSYTIFYVLGTFGATSVPVVGWAPLKSLEQLAPCAVFVAYQTLQVSELQRRHLAVSFHSTKAWQIRVRNFGVVATATAVLVAALFPMGHFGPLSSRVRGLFVKHTRTGNPLVDSVAEHQPANEQAYKTYLHHTYLVAPYGLALSLLRNRPGARFLVLWTVVVSFFANKVTPRDSWSRLIGLSVLPFTQSVSFFELSVSPFPLSAFTFFLAADDAVDSPHGPRRLVPRRRAHRLHHGLVLQPVCRISSLCRARC
jgi:dolichyl-diphosphooligosaccharide--protein glycosyltransferase